MVERDFLLEASHLLERRIVHFNTAMGLDPYDGLNYGGQEVEQEEEEEEEEEVEEVRHIRRQKEDFLFRSRASILCRGRCP